MSKHQGTFTENFNIFFSNAGKTEKVPEFESENNIRIAKPLSLHNFILLQILSGKKTRPDLQGSIFGILLTIQVKHSYITKPLCILFP